MTLVLRDSIDATLIPRDTPVVAGYGDGRYLWSPAWKASGGLPQGANWWDLFPRAVQLVIVVNAANQGDVLDVENGDATPADVPGWCDRFARAGRRAPTVYCNRDTWPLVQQAAGGRRVDYWIGTLDGTRDVPGAVAVQYVDTGAYDESVIHDPSWVGLEVNMTQGQLEEMVDSWYWTLLGRPVESDAARQSWVAKIAPDGSNARVVRDQFAETDEAIAYGRQVAALKAGPVAVGTHDHDFAGTTGPAKPIA